MEGEMHTPQERIRLERRKRITINLEIQKKPHGYSIYLRVTENGQRGHGAKAELRIRDSWHFWEYWHNALRLRLRLSLPFASHNFDRP